MTQAQRWCRCGHHLDRHAGSAVRCEMSGCPCRRFRAEPRGLWGRVLEALRPLPPN